MASEMAGMAERIERRMGRPARTHSVATRFTKEEEGELTRAAEDLGITVREWAREVLLREARRTKQDAVFTELVSMRMLLNNVLKVVATGQKITAENFQEIQAGVRADKKRVASEILQQYATPAGKEQ